MAVAEFRLNLGLPFLVVGVAETIPKIDDVEIETENSVSCTFYNVFAKLRH